MSTKKSSNNTTPTDNRFDVRYKILMVGETGVGKTSLMRCFIGGAFNPSMAPTIGFDLIHQTLEVDGTRVNLEVWDSAGQERFHTLTRATFRGSKGIILVYDVTNRRSFGRLTYWLKSIELEFADQKEPIPVFIVGNKSDLMQDRAVTEAEGKEKAKQSYAGNFRETSVKIDPEGVRRVFERMAYVLTETYDRHLMTSYMTPETRKKHGRSLPDDAKEFIRNTGSTSLRDSFRNYFRSDASKKYEQSVERTIKLGEGINGDKKKEKKCCRTG